MKQLSKTTGISLLLLLSFCTSEQKQQELYFAAIEDFVLGSVHYFPLNRLTYLDSLKKLELERECAVNIDSLFQRWAIADQYSGGSVSEAKRRSLYRDLMVACAGSEDFEVVFYSQAVSTWALDAFRRHYEGIACESSGLDFQGGGIAGLPYEFVKVEDVRFVKEAVEQNRCTRYLKLSDIQVCEKYRLIELVEGCGNTGEQSHLYVLVEFFGKWVVEDRLSTRYTF
jgi:hypothetical protein